MTEMNLQEMRTQLLSEVKDAEAALGSRTLAAQARYTNALYELDRVERLIHRIEMDKYHSSAAH